MRNILFITVDQQRYDALGTNGGSIAQTPTLDALARAGINYRRAHVQNVVCMPSRATMLTGQYPRTHGVIANGVPLPEDAPSVARYLRAHAGYRTALIGKAHFEPHLDLRLRFFENRCAAEGSTGPWRGFDHIELSTHGPLSGQHYAQWLRREHPEHVAGFGGVLSGEAGGDTGAPEVTHNRVPREVYHTDWIARRAAAWLRSIEPGQPWFLWVSFPDPHHPFDPPLSEVRKRAHWKDLPLPDGWIGDAERKRHVLSAKPRHWLDWYEGRYRNPEGGPIAFRPTTLTDDRVREVTAMIRVENELIDEACSSLLDSVRARGDEADTDVLYTSDHGELQGDFGLMFKGPYHVDALLRVPLLWRPAPSAGVAAAEVSEPVGLVDIAPTICRIAGLEPPDWMQGQPLPVGAPSRQRAVLTEFDSQFAAVGMHLRTVYCDGWLCTHYAPSTRDVGGRFRFYWSIWGRGSQVPRYDGSEGELYDCARDPLQQNNLWSDPAHRARRDELVRLFHDLRPPARPDPLPFSAPT